MKYMSTLVIGALLISLAPQPVQAQNDTVGTVLNVINAVANNRGQRDYYRRGNPYGDGGYQSYSPYGYGGYQSYSPYGSRGYQSYNPYGISSPYGYRAVRRGLPFGAASYTDQGDFRNYRDAYGNFLGREQIW